MITDCSTSVNHVQSQHHHSQFTIVNSCADDLASPAQGHCDVELDDDEPTCLKVSCRQTEDALESVVRLECPYCQRKDFDSVGPLTSHIRTAHARPSNNLFTCASCGLAFATVDKLDQHRQVEHDNPTSSTSAISAASSSGQGSPGVDLEPRFLCRFCPVQFYDAQTQRDHEQTIHLGRSSVGHQVPAVSSSVVYCSQCSLGFPHIYALADHMHHSHGYNTLARVRGSAPPGSDAAARSRDPVRPTAVRADSQRASTTSATCSDCSATFDTEDELESHVASAHYLSLGTEYGCTSCLKLFAKPEDLQKHLMDVHAHQLFRCTLCKQVFDSKVRQHRSIPTFRAYIFRLHRMRGMRTIAIDDLGRLSVCPSQCFAVKTRMNGSRSCLWSDSPRAVRAESFGAAFAKCLWPLVLCR